LQGEYVLGITTWFSVRPYAGFITASTDKDDIRAFPSEYEVTTNAFLLGGKVRVLAPIPWFAPFFEIGLGASLGRFKTITSLANTNKKGLALHIPFNLGVALGPKHNIELAFVYYVNPYEEQVSGGAALGFSIPLD
jgi:hypothetical protein